MSISAEHEVQITIVDCHSAAGRRVLELGCGSNPLVMFAALRHARRVVSTDGSLEALQQMGKNLALNAR